MPAPDTAVEPAKALTKAPTGVVGLDEVTRGGLPRGRATLLCGGPGCGKTVLAMEFAVRGARDHNEPAVFVSFEEPLDDLRRNFASLGFDLPSLERAGKLRLSHVQLAPHELHEAGEFSLDGLLVRLEEGISAVGAKRIVFDTLDAVFGAFDDGVSLRRELVRLFGWLKQTGVTAVITAERGKGDLTRHGMQEYVSDCVLLLDHRVEGDIAKRRLRVVKYRGSDHGKDEYPFLIGPHGASVLPITSLSLEAPAREDIVSSGVDDLDALLGRGGLYRGSSVLLSGTAGTGKSSLAASFAERTCEDGHRCLYLAFEEAPGQIVRNMRSVGIDLARHLDSGLLVLRAARPTLFGLEEHLVSILDAVDTQRPAAVVLDPISNFLSIGRGAEIRSMLVRVFDHLKEAGITVLATHLTPGSGPAEQTTTNVSSLMDVWLVLRNEFEGQHRVRSLYVAKARGMAVSEQTHALTLSSSGLALHPVGATPTATTPAVANTPESTR